MGGPKKQIGPEIKAPSIDLSQADPSKSFDELRRTGENIQNSFNDATDYLNDNTPDLGNAFQNGEFKPENIYKNKKDVLEAKDKANKQAALDSAAEAAAPELERVRQVTNFLNAFGKARRAAPGRALTLLGGAPEGPLLTPTGKK